jgi:hypothetical protein
VTAAPVSEGEALLKLASAALSTNKLPPPVAVRAALVLGRQSLETILAARLEGELPGAQLGSFRAQLLCLSYLDERAGRLASHLHGTFSRSCHHQAYELTPTPAEVETLLEQVALLVPTSGRSHDPARN